MEAKGANLMPDKLAVMVVDWFRFIAGDREYFVRTLDYGGLMGDPLGLTLPPSPGKRRNPVVRPPIPDRQAPHEAA